MISEQIRKITRHPNVARIYAMVQDKHKRLYLVSEYAERGSLQTALNSGMLTEKRKVK